MSLFLAYEANLSYGSLADDLRGESVELDWEQLGRISTSAGRSAIRALPQRFQRVGRPWDLKSERWCKDPDFPIFQPTSTPDLEEAALSRRWKSIRHCRRQRDSFHAPAAANFQNSPQKIQTFCRNPEYQAASNLWDCGSSPVNNSVTLKPSVTSGRDSHNLFTARKLRQPQGDIYNII